MPSDPASGIQLPKMPDEPLLQRPSSENSSDRAVEEEDALLTGQRTNRSYTRSPAFWRQAGAFTWAILATITVIILAIAYEHERSIAASRRPRSGGWGPDGKPTGKRNLIFMVSDGMGPASLSLTRSWRQYESGLPIDDILVLDQHLIGTSRTRSSSSLVTDSAAGATAFSCARKSYNGAISVTPDHEPCGTILEAAKKAGYLTGLVVTTRITDATPACFASHANRREFEDLIAEQEIGNYPLGRQVDLLMGGGRCHFLPNTTDGSCRADDKNVVELAKKNGFNYIDSRKDLDHLTDLGKSVELPLLALFADRDIPYEIDRIHAKETYPSQAEMAKAALNALKAATKDSDKGFFIMIEGSRVDHAGHDNDPAAQVREVMAHDEAFAVVLDFLKNDDTEGVVVSTSDHETGGLSTAKQLHLTYPSYRWFPGVLANVTRSAQYVAADWKKWLNGDGASANDVSKRRYIKLDLAEKWLGIKDTTDEEADAIINAEPIWPPMYLFGEMVSRRAQIGWSSHGHSGKSEYLGRVYVSLTMTYQLLTSTSMLRTLIMPHR